MGNAYIILGRRCEPQVIVIEAEVHSSLLRFLGNETLSSWPHHLTMARLVARALRSGRPALIQTSTARVEYVYSYLMPALLWDDPVILVTPTHRRTVINQKIPRLQQWLKTDKQGLRVIESHSWLTDRLLDPVGAQGCGPLPPGVPTIIDCADDLAELTREVLTATIKNWHWDELITKCPQKQEQIRNLRVKLTQAFFHHPRNPYECYLLQEGERVSLERLCQMLASGGLLTPAWSNFWQRWQTNGQVLWASINREIGAFSLHVGPVEVATAFQDFWQQQPVVLIGSFLDWEKTAPTYRQQLGLPKMLAVKFTPVHHNYHFQLYLPKTFPLPNTPQFKDMLIEQIRILVGLGSNREKPIVLLVEDTPLKDQVGAEIAAQFGSRVGVERIDLGANGILVSGWQFWHQYQDLFGAFQLLAIATLPLPSLENPLVAARIAYYKDQGQDWFRLYLLPTALREIQRAVVPLRGSEGVVALFDHRVNCRSYGSKILAALEPYNRFNYIDPSWFGLV